MKKRYIPIAAASLLLATIACTLALPGLPTAEPVPPSPVPTALPPASVEPATAEAVSVTAGVPLEANLIELYKRASQGVVTVWTFADLGPPHDEGIPTGQGSGFSGLMRMP